MSTLNMAPSIADVQMIIFWAVVLFGLVITLFAAWVISR